MARSTSRAVARTSTPAAPARAAPSLDPQAMLVFASLARSGGVRGAAAALGVPRSTVSRRLAQLEASVGASLVVRTARRFTLTETGVALAQRAAQLEQLLREAQDVAQAAAGEASGVLRVAAAPVLGEEILPAIVAELLARYPRLAVDVRMSVDYVDLRRGDVDVALRAWELPDAGDVFATRLGVSVTGCYASPAYVRERGAPEVPADLLRHECIVVGSARPKSWDFEEAGQRVRVPVEGRARVDSFRLGRALAARGVGVVRTAQMFAAPLVARGELVPLLQAYWPATPVHAVHAGPNPPAPRVRAFIELARKVVAATLPAR